jgi:hypothetical protein
MKLRFSLRSILLLVVPAVAAFAFLYCLRQQPAEIARNFQIAVQKQDAPTIDKLLPPNELKTAIAASNATLKKDRWELKSVTFEPQNTSQWLRGVCAGKLAIYTLGGSSVDGDTIWSASEEGTCDVEATASGIRLIAFESEGVAVGGAPAPPYGP